MQRLDGFLIERTVFPDGGVGAAAGLHAADAFRGQRGGAGQDALVLEGVDVVGDDGEVVTVAQLAAQHFKQRGLAAADRAADADFEGSHSNIPFCFQL